MSRMVQIAITCCPECYASFDLDEWRGLKLLGETVSDKGSFEKRGCSLCSAEVSARVDGLDDLNLWVSAESYTGMFPTSDRAFVRAIELRPTLRERLRNIDWSGPRTWGPGLGLAIAVWAAIVLTIAAL